MSIPDGQRVSFDRRENGPQSGTLAEIRMPSGPEMAGTVFADETCGFSGSFPIKVRDVIK
jgi:hypothetical protein